MSKTRTTNGTWQIGGVPHRPSSCNGGGYVPEQRHPHHVASHLAHPLLLCSQIAAECHRESFTSVRTILSEFKVSWDGHTERACRRQPCLDLKWTCPSYFGTLLGECLCASIGRPLGRNPLTCFVAVHMVQAFRGGLVQGLNLENAPRPIIVSRFISFSPGCQSCLPNVQRPPAADPRSHP